MLIGITGTLGAGKGAIVQQLKKHGFTHHSASGYLKEVLEERGEHIDRDAYSKLASEIRTADEAGLARILHRRIVERNEKDAVIEALHDVGEAQYIKDQGGIVLAIDAPIKERFRRVTGRASEKDNVTFEHFLTQVKREEDGGGKHNIKAVIEMADITIMNDGSLKELGEHIEQFLHTIKQ